MNGQNVQDAFLIAGLGNPGPEHQANRHNAGFQVIDQLAAQLGGNLKMKLVGLSMIAQGTHVGVPLILAKPQAFMNESGRAVAQLVRILQGPTRAGVGNLR